MNETSFRRRPWLGVRWLVSIAILGAVAAGAYVAAPVEQDSLVYGYQPAVRSTGADGAGDSAAASLALARPSADALHVELSCDEPGSTLSTSAPPAWVNRPGSLTFKGLGNALYVRVGDGSVEATKNGDLVIRVEVGNEPGCVATLDYRNGLWRLEAEGREVSAEDGPGRVSEAWFTGPAATDPRSTVMVETRELGTSPTGIQILFMAIAVIALMIVSRELVVRGSRRAAVDEVVGSVSRLKRLRIGIRFVDLAVVGTLFLWLILIPVNIDDGWVAATVRSYDAQGDLSGVFRANGFVFPFGYWNGWLQHLWFGLDSSAVMMRLPAFALGVGIWAGLRSIVRRLEPSGNALSLWLMGAVFVVGFGAWGMTLRVEPVIAMLVVMSVLLAIRFAQGSRGWVLVAWAVVIALALASHPAGILVLAPVIASGAAFRDWIRSETEARYLFIVWLLVVGSLLLLVWFFDSNLPPARTTISSLRNSSAIGILI